MSSEHAELRQRIFGSICFSQEWFVIFFINGLFDILFWLRLFVGHVCTVPFKKDIFVLRDMTRVSKFVSI